MNTRRFNFCAIKSLLSLLCAFGLAINPSGQASDTPQNSACGADSTALAQDKIIKTNLTGIGIVTAWGVANWDYFTRSPHAQSEGWFGNNTDEGGADKLGHLYTTYITAHGLAHWFESECVAKDDAALYGALSSLAILGYMEVGDAFSDYGFAYEDMVANSVGAVLGYYLYKDAALAKKLDLRWEYGVHPNKKDFTTDYENSRYLAALKFNGFEFGQKPGLKHLELHAGYYSRGFADANARKERKPFIGIGLNITDLFNRRGYKKTATALRYLQVPGTAIRWEMEAHDE